MSRKERARLVILAGVKAAELTLVAAADLMGMRICGRSTGGPASCASCRAFLLGADQHFARLPSLSKCLAKRPSLADDAIVIIAGAGTRGNRQ